MQLIVHVGLMRSVIGLGKCYEGLAMEFIVNIPADCDDSKSMEYRKVSVRGKCVEFSLEVINRYMGRSEDEKPELEMSDNQIYKVITAK